ncbi:hypothetical protein E5720_18890 [Rhodococcus sp. PAMC28707]|uniref:WhiB family transcriptional regulator n=1 Tax=unclassified Rhodococcus (in: high G+C Gram-positive bacteria) TaxID=192944 RepID=UPI00109E23DB|nr:MULTISPECIES: WhiB family transcriptional regulator [unclassified Rhodococcus (in: high G+C Gram-positive bacteria)]QCB51600.1 hypothetical protein E5769_16635 [Rhodococcus sp. PAMC28705]QCB60232.1 hypothetical protein E5720_18890 [Rhodococcus sp. PAMC28707]
MPIACRRRERAAKQTCASCPALVQRRTYACGTGKLHGIWGGLTASERKVNTASRTRRAV